MKRMRIAHYNNPRILSNIAATAVAGGGGGRRHPAGALRCSMANVLRKRKSSPLCR
ncbi:MAG: hypothetical protein ISP90_09455 [Nevskia sp.]|nr:hypothetical protein [Nevskia sp.]